MIAAIRLTLEEDFKTVKRFRAAHTEPPIIQRSPTAMVIERLEDGQAFCSRELIMLLHSLYSLGKNEPRPETGASRRTTRVVRERIAP